MKIVITLNKTTTSTMISNVKDMTNTICDSMGMCGDKLNRANELCDSAINKVDTYGIDFKVANPASSLALKSKDNDVVVDFEVSDKIILSTMKIFGKIAQRIAPIITMAKGAYGIIKSLAGDVKNDFEELYKDYEVPADQCKYGVYKDDVVLFNKHYDVTVILRDDGYNGVEHFRTTVSTGDHKVSRLLFDHVKETMDVIKSNTPMDKTFADVKDM